MLAQTAKLPSGSQCEPKEAIVNLHENNVQVLQVEYVNEVKCQHVTQKEAKNDLHEENVRGLDCKFFNGLL